MQIYLTFFSAWSLLPGHTVLPLRLGTAALLPAPGQYKEKQFPNQQKQGGSKHNEKYMNTHQYRCKKYK